ncbi:plantaricin C family lantibiotic [Dolosigranulum pigrum]|uniref:plantaricin C family lantibiotic n=1 Tax=Dolosigranulum pigrum TaxID=29394 RepID=UPI00155E125F|nr:plantaricin C family lantibiotic [Dolosigranulum pigrum]QJS95850.1 plantaricin C family lantibiotic [Dolosigranulum pigrum]
MKKEELVGTAKENFLNVICENDNKLENSGAKCPWWNLSCHLGNDGKICTYSHECTAGCNV